MVKKRMGRPPKAGESMTANIGVRLTPTQYEWLLRIVAEMERDLGPLPPGLRVQITPADAIRVLIALFAEHKGLITAAERAQMGTMPSGTVKTKKRKK